MSALASFAVDEAGAVTVDWVTVTAVVLLLGIAVIYSIYGNGAEPVVNDVNSELKTYKMDITPTHDLF